MIGKWPVHAAIGTALTPLEMIGSTRSALHFFSFPSAGV